ncbi:hypothetical protein VTJ83DRAFT_5406 [Remersonia thermophila]|uniref:Copper-fist domain-containing protein n=1 Tax=Remersonia thermophila TaxID=72144 RepID=A0ABR4D8X9_9PEZI
MIINGEKWACEACVRGHRVSNCQHSDRPLQHINKKGRPVSQCQHCRAMRKSRAAHVKCDCGEKTQKCVHLRPPLEGHKASCCCNHGGRCTCCQKREPQLDTVPESDSDEAAATRSRSSKSSASARSRRRAHTAGSDAALLSFDANGHHKPTYKHPKASHKVGPYQLNRAHSMTSATATMRNRSMDDLYGAADSTSPGSGSGSDGMVVNSQAQQRRAKSEATSPALEGSSFAQLNSQLPPLDLSGIKYPPYIPNSADFFGALSDYEQPMFSAGLSGASVDWSHYEGLELASKTADFAPSNYSQAQSYGGFDFAGSENLPGMTTTSTSGDVSEVEDFLSNPLDDFDTFPTAATSGTGFGFGTAAATHMSDLFATADGLHSSLDLVDDLDFVAKKDVGSKFLSATSVPADDQAMLAAGPAFGTLSALDDDPAFWINEYAVPGLTDSPPSFWDNQ